MSWLEIISETFSALSPAQAALIGVLMGSSINWITTGINNSALKEKERLNAFYLKLLEKRMAVYDELEAVLGVMNKVVFMEDNRRIPLIISDKEAYAKAFNDFQALKNKMRWFEFETFEAFLSLDNLLRSLGQGIGGPVFDAEYINKARHLVPEVVNLMNLAHKDFFHLQKNKFKPRLIHRDVSEFWLAEPGDKLLMKDSDG